MDFILLSVYILTNICFSLGGMTPKTIIIASETSRWIHQSGTPPLTDYHASKHMSSHNRASPYMAMTSIPVQTSITSSQTSSISTNTSTSVHQSIVPSRSTTNHQAGATKVISPRYSVNNTDSRTNHLVFSDSASDSSTYIASAVHLSDGAQSQLLLQSSMVEAEHDSDTLATSRRSSTGIVNTETMTDIFIEKSLETATDSLKFNDHQIQKSTSSISTFDILRDSNFTASQIADWFESVISRSTSKSNTTSVSTNSSQTATDIELQSDSEIHQTSTYSKGSDYISETPLSLSITPASFQNTLQSFSSKYSSSNRVRKTDSITYSSASDFLVTYALINVFKAHKEETQTTKGSYFKQNTNNISPLGITSLSESSRHESISETSGYEKDVESWDLQSSVQPTISTSVSSSTQNTDFMKTPSLKSHFMSEPSSRQFSTELYENPVEIRGQKTLISVSTDADNSLSIEEPESAVSSRTERLALPIASSTVWLTDGTRTKISEIVSVSETGEAHFPDTAADIISYIQPNEDDIQTVIHSSGTTIKPRMSSANGETAWPSSPLYKEIPPHSGSKIDNTLPSLPTNLPSHSVSPGLLFDNNHEISSSIIPSVSVLISQGEFVVASQGVIVTDSRKQVFSQTSETTSYFRSKTFSDIKPSASKKAFTSTLLNSDNISSASDMTRLVSNQTVDENSLRIHAATYSTDQSAKASATDLVIDTTDVLVSDITVTASDVESFSSLETFGGNTFSSDFLPTDVSTVSARTLKSDLPVSAITESSMSRQRDAPTSMDVNSSELHSKSSAEPFLQIPSISINIKTKHSRQKGTSKNISTDSPTVLSTAVHSRVFDTEENTPDPTVAPMRTSMSRFDSISGNDRLFSDSHSDAAAYSESSSSETNPSGYSTVDTVLDTLYSSLAAESKLSTITPLNSEVNVPYAATISFMPSGENKSTLGVESSSFPFASSLQDSHSHMVQTSTFREDPDVTIYSSMVDSSHNQEPHLAMTESQTSIWQDISDISTLENDFTFPSILRPTSDGLYNHNPSSSSQQNDQSESTKFQKGGREDESTVPHVWKQYHSTSISSTALNLDSSKTASFTKYHAYLPMSTYTIVGSSTMDQIMEQSLILREKQVADKNIASQDDSVSLSSTTYNGNNIESKPSDHIQSASVLPIDQPKLSTTHLARSTTPVLHSRILDQIAPSSQIIHSDSVASLVEERNSGSDAVEMLVSLGNNVESSGVHSSLATKDGEILQATLSSIDTSHEPTQSNRQTPLLSEMPSKQLTSTTVISLLQTTSVGITSSSNPHPTVHTQGRDTEAQKSDFILKWVFDPKGEDVTSEEFLAKVAKGLQLSYETGLKTQINVRLRRDTASTSNVDIQIKSTKPRSDGSIEMEFTVTRNGQKILARDAYATFNKISLNELNRNTGVTSLGMMGLTSLQPEQVLLNGGEPRPKSTINLNNGYTNDITQSATPVGNTVVTVETKDSQGDVSSQSKTPLRRSSATFESSSIAAQTTADTAVSVHIMTSIDNSYVSSTDVVIEMVIISNQQEPDISKEMNSISSAGIYNGFQQRSIQSGSSTTPLIQPSVTISESDLISEDATYSILEQVRSSLVSELGPPSGEPSPSFHHDLQATISKPVETKKYTSFPNAAAAWDGKLVTTFYDERLLSSPLYIESSVSGIDVTKSTTNELVSKSTSQSSSELFVTLTANEPQMSSYVSSVRSSYEPSFISSPSITDFVQETPLLTSTNGVTLKPITYGSSSVSDPQTYPLSLASRYSDVTSPSDMIDDLSSFSVDIDALTSLPGIDSKPIIAAFSSRIILSEFQKDSLSSHMPSDYGFDTLFEASRNNEMFVSSAERSYLPISSAYEPPDSALNVTSFPPPNRSNATRMQLSSTRPPSPFNTRMDSKVLPSFSSLSEDVSNADFSNFETSTPVPVVNPTYDVNESEATALEPYTWQVSSTDAILSQSAALDMNPTSSVFTNGISLRSESIDPNLLGTDTTHLTGTMLSSTHLRFSSILSPEMSQSKVSQMISSDYFDPASSALRVVFDASSTFSTKHSGTKRLGHSSASPSLNLKTSMSSKPSLLLQSTSLSTSYGISSSDVSEPPHTMFLGDVDSSWHITSSKSFTNVPMTNSGSMPTMYADGRYSSYQWFPSVTSTGSRFPVTDVMRSSAYLSSIKSSTVSGLSSTVPVISASKWTVLSVQSSALPNTERFSSMAILPPSTEELSIALTKALSTEQLPSSEKSSTLSAPPSTEKTMSVSMSMSMSTEGLSPLYTRPLSIEMVSALSTRSLSTDGLSSLPTRSLSTDGLSSLPTRSLSAEGISSKSSKTSSAEVSSPFPPSNEGSVFSTPVLFSTKGSLSSTGEVLPSTRPLLFEHSSSVSTLLDMYSFSVYPTVTAYSNEPTRVHPYTSSQTSVLSPVLTSLSSYKGETLVSTTTLPLNPSFSAESSVSVTRTIPIIQSSSRVSPVSATTGVIYQSFSGQYSEPATITGPINQVSSRVSLSSAKPLPINPSTSVEDLASITTVSIHQSSSGEPSDSAITVQSSYEESLASAPTLTINPSSGKLSINPSSQETFLAPTATVPINPSSKTHTPATSTLMSSSVPSSTSLTTPQSTMWTTSVHSPDPESSRIPTAHPRSSPPPSTTVPASDGPPVDTLMLLIMNIGLDVNITSAQFSRQLEKDLAELYVTALKQRSRRDTTQRQARHRRQSGVNAQVVSNERDPGDDFKVTTTFAVSDGGDFVAADVAVPVFNRISQEQTSDALAHSVLGPITAAQTSSKPQLEDSKDNSYILILCIVIPAALLVLAILFLVTRMRRRRRANAVGDLPPRYQRGDTLEDHNLTVDVEKGEIVDKTPASTPSLSPRSNSSTGKKVPLLGGVCVLPGVGDGDGLRRQDSDKYRELTQTDYPEQVLLADQEKDSHRSLILREKELLEKLGVHENQKEIDSCDEHTLELPRRTKSKKGKGKAASSQYNTVGSECPLLSSSGSITTVSSIDSGDHTDASDEFTVIIPKTKSPKIKAKIQKESTSTGVSASGDEAGFVPNVSEAQLTSVAVQASAAEQVNVCPEMRSVDTQTSKDASLTSDTDSSSPDEKGETIRDKQGDRPETECKQVQTPWVRKIRHTHDIFIDDDDLSYPNSPVNTRLSISAGPGETSFIFPETANTVYHQTVHEREEEAKRAKAQQLMVEVVQQRKNLAEHPYSQAEQDLDSPSISSLESDSDLTINSDQLSLEDDSLEDAILAMGPLRIAQQSEMTTTWSRKSSGITYVGSESGESPKEYRDIYPAQGCVRGTNNVTDSPQPNLRTGGHKKPHDSSSKHSLAAQIEQEAIFEEEEAVRKTEETARRAQQLLNQTHALGFALAPGESQSDLVERIREEVRNSGSSVPGSQPSCSKSPKTPVPKPRKDHTRGSSSKGKQESSEPSGSPTGDRQGASNLSQAAPKSSKVRSSDSTAALLERVRGELQRLDSQQSDSDSEMPDDVPSQMP